MKRFSDARCTLDDEISCTVLVAQVSQVVSLSLCVQRCCQRSERIIGHHAVFPYTCEAVVDYDGFATG